MKITKKKYLYILTGIIFAIILLNIFIKIYFNIVWQFPAPVGDSALFAPLSINYCSDGIFQNPIFSVDPSGHSRYIWHGIMQPALLGFLNFNCKNSGNYFALTIIEISTLFLILLIFRNKIGLINSIILATICFSLQVKQGFRPEVLAILICLFAEYFRHIQRPVAWTLLISILAWTQPTIFIIYIIFSFLAYKKNDINLNLGKWTIIIVFFIFINLIILYFYPFPIIDLIKGLISQGKSFSIRNDGDFFTYYIKSDFFPFFGILFFLSLLIFSLKNKKIIFILPIVYFYALKVPPTYYNIIPLFSVFIFNLMVYDYKESKKLNYLNENFNILILLFLYVTLISALLGITLGNMRDINSSVQYGAKSQSALDIINNFDKNNITYCKVPPFFAVLISPDKFTPSLTSSMKNCIGREYLPTNIDLIKSQKNIYEYSHCKFSSEKIRNGIFNFIFKEDSGYSFYICQK
ncbi:hypothetical protein ACVBEF_13400 [Glaciimonas sp. GG7]